jgi:peroxiredoxin
MDPMIKIGDQAPNFELPELNGTPHSLQSMLGRIVVLNFWSAECDWCSRVDGELLAYFHQWQGAVEVWWIASNANEPAEMVERVTLERHLPTVLIDRDQRIADLYRAQTTPHFFVVGKDGTLQYQGAWDDITFRQRTATRKHVPSAVADLIGGNPPVVTESPPYGCTLVRFENITG